MSKQHWLKRDKILLQKLKDEDEKLKLYFDEKSGKILYDNNLVIYDKKVYHQWLKKQIIILELKIYKARMNGYRLGNYQPKCIEEKLGRLMHIYQKV